MSRITAILAIVLTLAPTVAMANCRMHTVLTGDGRMITCNTCCYGGSCTSHCF